MSRRVQTQIPVLKSLCKCTGSKRKQLLQVGGKDLQLCLDECAVNVLKGHVPLSQKHFSQLKKYKQPLRNLSLRKTSQKKRRQIVQRGGFLPALLAPIIASLAGTVINAVANRKKK